MNIKMLTRLGLEGNRAKVYLAVLKLGRATVIDISKHTKIKRTTVYDVVLDLKNQGFVSEAKRGARRVFIAEDPATLVQTFEDRLSEIKEIAPLLSNVYSTNIPKPTLRFYDGISGVRHITEELLTMKGKEMLSWSSISDLVDVLGNRYLERWVKRRVKRGIISRVLLTQKSRVPQLYLRSDTIVLREIKWLPQDFTFDGLLSVFDNKVIYISSLKESFGFVLESDEMSSLMRLIFKSMWDSAHQDSEAR